MIRFTYTTANAAQRVVIDAETHAKAEYSLSEIIREYFPTKPRDAWTLEGDKSKTASARVTRRLAQIKHDDSGAKGLRRDTCIGERMAYGDPFMS
jgi:hypothetical protein